MLVAQNSLGSVCPVPLTVRGSTDEVAHRTTPRRFFTSAVNWWPFGSGGRAAPQRRWTYAGAIYEDDDATLDDLREAVSTLEDTERTARRVLGGAHPDVVRIEKSLREAREAVHARESQPGSASA